MHASRKLRLITYDVRDAKRLRKAHCVLKGYGGAVQLSVFFCYLDNRQLAELRGRLAQILTKEDLLLISDVDNVVTDDKNTAAWSEPPPSFSVVLAFRQAGESS